jgi:hypothetical protein
LLLKTRGSGCSIPRYQVVGLGTKPTMGKSDREGKHQLDEIVARGPPSSLQMNTLNLCMLMSLLLLLSGFLLHVIVEAPGDLKLPANAPNLSNDDKTPKTTKDKEEESKQSSPLVRLERPKNKRPRRQVKKDPNAPKRFKSSYIFFTQSKYKEINERLAREGIVKEKVRKHHHIPLTSVYEPRLRYRSP